MHPNMDTAEPSMSDKKATLTIDGIDEPIELPVYSGAIGPDVVDVGGLTAIRTPSNEIVLIAAIP